MMKSGNMYLIEDGILKGSRVNMNIDFTLKKYDELCSAIADSGYTSVKIKSYLAEAIPKKAIILRHDVDSRIESALKMAQIEKEYSLSATYYFRADAINNSEIMRGVENLGHEIGYHYEVMDKAKGNHVKAIKIFKIELEKFMEITDVKTVCMHGTPSSPYDNLELWKYVNFNQFNILGEAYLSVDFDKILYFSDTSRTWNGTKFKVKDIVKSTHPCQEKIKTTDDLINLIKDGEKDRIYILTHPARWKGRFSDSIKDIIYQKFKNVGKRLLHSAFQNKRKNE